MSKQTKAKKRRTKVKDLPVREKELTTKEEQKVKGGAGKADLINSIVDVVK